MITIIATFSAIIPLLIGIKYYKYQDDDMKTLIWYLFFSLVFSIAGYFMAVYGINNHWLMNLFLLIYLIFFGIIFLQQKIYIIHVFFVAWLIILWLALRCYIGWEFDVKFWLTINAYLFAASLLCAYKAQNNWFFYLGTWIYLVYPFIFYYFLEDYFKGQNIRIWDVHNCCYIMSNLLYAKALKNTNGRTQQFIC